MLGVEEFGVKAGKDKSRRPGMEMEKVGLMGSQEPGQLRPVRGKRLEEKD